MERRSFIKSPYPAGYSFCNHAFSLFCSYFLLRGSMKISVCDAARGPPKADARTDFFVPAGEELVTQVPCVPPSVPPFMRCWWERVFAMRFEGCLTPSRRPSSIQCQLARTGWCVSLLMHGRCHCGNLCFDLDWELESTGIPARACACSFCARHGGLWTSQPQGILKIHISDPSLVSRYAFGTATADFLVCARCGVVSVATSCIEGRLYAVVNVQALDDIDPSLFRHESVHLDNEEKCVRIARRKQNWIANVAYVERTP